MKNILKPSIKLFLAFYTLLIILMLSGKVTFGYGLGDLYPFGVSIIFYVINCTYYFCNHKYFDEHINLAVLNLLLLLGTIVYILLNVTIYRGVEYPWNGNLFYPN